MRAWKLSWLVASVLFLGCQESLPVSETLPAGPDEASSLFDPQTTGTLNGQVVWSGETPHVPPFLAPVSPQWEPGGKDFLQWPNPNVPVIDAGSGGVKDAVVYLREVDSRRARPWDHPQVCVEQRDYRIRILQGDMVSRCGIVRRGDAIAMVSRQGVFHSLHGGGANFFTLAFPDPDKPLTRRLDRPGLVELSSAAGCFWMRGYLFVADHPYYCRTDSRGKFTLPQVPAGDYELVCWHPSWREQGHDRDPESALISRLYFAPPVEVVRSVHIDACATQSVFFTLTAEAFSH